MRALLDTCTFLWLALDPKRISKAAAEIINDESIELALSQVSVMEIVMKCRSGKLPLPEAPHLWIPTRRNFFKLEDASITEAIIYRSGQLPDVHNDPFDRLIAAHAIESSATLLSPDSPLSALGASRIW
jgi:PIN domain nuclease of toxin-antitoxin system